MSTADSRQEITLTLPGKSKDDIFAERAVGREAIGEAYEFTVDVISRDTLDLDSMLGKAAKLEIVVVDEIAVVHGVIASAQTLDPTANREFCYRFVLMPELAMLRFNAQNQVYGTDQDVTVVDIIESELNDAKSGSNTAASRISRVIRHDMLVDKSSYPMLDFVMQYCESDFDFLSRQCERFGIYFFFDHDGDREKVLFCDRKEHFRRLGGRDISEEIPFRLDAHGSQAVEFSIRSFNAVYAAQSGAVQFREYNDETPNVDLTVTENAPFQGQGLRVDYYENYRTTSEGQFLAKRRVEALQAGRVTYEGRSNIPLLRPGVFFQLKDHPIRDLEQTYVVTEVEHEITEQTPVGLSAKDIVPTPYRNRFVCVPFDMEYRRAMRTPKPIASGYMTGFIDGESEGKRAELDEHGRYKVRLQAEESSLKDGKASCFVRKVEPYGGGDGHGTHSTLLIGTEVVLGFLHGDPDRPIILGAVSNAEQTNPVTEGNANVAQRTKTSSGIVFQICDGAA